MAQFQYNGEEEMVFPTISVTVKKGDKFDAPDDFSAVGVSPVSSVSSKKSESSAKTDTSAGA